MSLEHIDKRQSATRRGSRFVTTRELCEELGLSRRTVYRRIADGSIERPVKLDMVKRGWTADYVDDLLAQVARGEAAWQQ